MPACSLVNVLGFWFGAMTGIGARLLLGVVEEAFFGFFVWGTVVFARCRASKIEGSIEVSAVLVSGTRVSSCVSGTKDVAAVFFLFDVAAAFDLTAGLFFFGGFSARFVLAAGIVLEAADSEVQYPFSTRNFVTLSRSYPFGGVSSGPNPCLFR